MKTEMEHRLELLTVTAKINACLELRNRVQEYLIQLQEEEEKLNAEGEAYDKANDAALEARDNEDIPF